MPVRGTRVLRRPGVHELRVYAGKDPVTGKSRTLTKTFRGGVRAADQALRDFVVEVEQGKQGRSTTATFGRLLNRWLASVEPSRSPTTMKEYRRLAKVTIIPSIGAIPLADLGSDHLDHLYTGLSARGLAPASVRQVHAIIRAALGQGRKWGWVHVNPADLASPPPLRARQPEAPTAADVQAIITVAEAEDPDLAAYIMLAALTGARRGELCGLRWGDVEWRKRLLLVERSWVVVDGQGRYKATKTDRSRVIALDDVALSALTTHRNRMRRRARTLGLDLDEAGPIFTYDLVHPISPNTATHYVHAVAKRAGVTTHLHALRHFAATQLVAANTDVRTVAARLGHADPSMTLRVYAHALPERDRDAATVLGHVLTAGPTPDP